jgi:hypothetical protein
LGQAIQSSLDEHLGLGARNEHTWSYGQLEVPKGRGSDHVLKGLSFRAPSGELQGDALDLVSRGAALGRLQQPVGLAGSDVDLGRRQQIRYSGAQLRPGRHWPLETR